jgi:hypothetical protein
VVRRSLTGRGALAVALAMFLGAYGCAAIADLQDWQIGSADAAADGPAEGGLPDDASVDAGGDASTDGPGADAGADAGCPFGCPRVAYDFDEDAGLTANDRSGNANTATLQNGVAWTAGIAGGALLFDGVNDVVDVPSSSSLDITGTGLSILFWVKIDDTKVGADDVIVNKAWTMNAMNAPYYQYGVEFTANSNKTLDLIFGVGTGTERGPFSMKPAVSVWTHAAFTYDGATVKGYLDGVEKLSTATTGSLVSRPTDLRLGVDGISAQAYKGALDDLRIYDRALSAAEIVALRGQH